MRISVKMTALWACVALTALLGSSGTAAAACPNEAIRATQTSEALPLGTTYLPSCMALEMVSPPHHFGQETREISAFSYDGARARFRSKAALADTPGLQAFPGDTYIAGRGPAGWASSSTSAPASAGITSGASSLFGGPYAFAPDLGSWTIFGVTEAQAFAGEGQFFHGALGGAFGGLSPVLTVIDDELTRVENLYNFDPQLTPQATAADLSAIVFPAPRTTASYLPFDPHPNVVANSYVAFVDAAGAPQLQLLARDNAGKVWGGRCGASVGAASVQGAISPNGDRIYFTARPAQPSFSPSEEAEGKYPACSDTSSATNPQRILVREQGAPGEQGHISELIPGGPTAGSDTFQAASADGQMVYLTTSRQLTASDGDSTQDLYLYDFARPPGDRLVQVSAGEAVGTEHEVGNEAEVTSLVALSTDGSHAYLTAKGVLTGAPNPVGGHAVKGQENLYLYDAVTGATSFIGVLGTGETLSAQAVPMLREPGSPAEGGDGHILALLTKARLAPAEDDDSGHVDAYRYDADAGTLTCLSCATPFPDAAPFDVSAGSGAASGGLGISRAGLPNFAEQGRWISDDGQVAAFATAEALEAGDEDGKMNPYLRDGDRIARLPATIVTGIATDVYMPTVSPGGEEVGFVTPRALLPQDTDSASDAYVVRVDGGFPNPVVPVSCDPLSEGSCQGSSSSAGVTANAATGTFSGPGNPTPKVEKPKHKKHKHKKHKRHHKGKHGQGKSRKHAENHKRAGRRQGGSK